MYYNYELDPEKFLSALGIAWQAALKTTAVKLKLVTDIDVLLIVEKELQQYYAMQFIDM